MALKFFTKVESLWSLGILLWGLPVSAVVTGGVTWLGWDEVSLYELIFRGIVLFYISFMLAVKLLKLLLTPDTYLEYKSSNLRNGIGNFDLVHKNNIYSMPRSFRVENDNYVIEYLVLFDKPIKKDFKIRIESILGDAPHIVNSSYDSRHARFVLHFSKSSCHFKVLFEPF